MNQQKIEHLLLPTLEKLEIERLKTARQIKFQKIIPTLVGLFVIGIMVAIFFSVVLQAEKFDEAITKMAIMMLVGFSVFGIVVIAILEGISKSLSQPLRERLEEQVKKEVYEKIFHTWNETIVYHPKRAISTRDVNQSKLFSGDAQFSGDDYCVGKLPDGRPFSFSELQARERVVTTSSDGVSSVQHKEVFKGLFFVLENTRPLVENTRNLTIRSRDQTNNYKTKIEEPEVKPKTIRPAASYNTNILDADLTPIAEPEPVKKEAPKEEAVPLFDQLYEVKSPKSNARENLPEDLSQHLNHLRASMQQAIALSYEGNTVYLAVAQQLDFWIVNAERSLVDKNRIRYLAWNFTVAFEALDRLSRMTTSEGPRF